MASRLPYEHFQEPVDRPASESDSAVFERVFDAVVELHYARLCNFALRILRRPDAAEDAVHEVLCKVWNRQSTESLGELVPYLYRAVRNQCLMLLRSERRWKLSDIGSVSVPDDRPNDGGEVRELQDAITRAIEELPERTRLVFTMHRQQDLTYGDIARALGISVKTVETQMSRALKMLRQRLGKFFP